MKCKAVIKSLSSLKILETLNNSLHCILSHCMYELNFYVFLYKWIDLDPEIIIIVIIIQIKMSLNLNAFIENVTKWMEANVQNL